MKKANTDKMNKKLKKILIGLGLLIGPPVLYFGALIGINRILMKTGERLETIQEAREYLEEEKRKLGCDKKINVRFREEKGAVAGRSSQKGEYDIILGRNCRNINVLQHELYHVYDDHTEKDKRGFFRAYFCNEPKAIWYSIWN